MSRLPTGTVTFLFTDIEGSTALLQRLKDAYPTVLAECRRLVRAAVEERSGQEFGAEGDAIFAAFPSAHDGLMAAITAQRGILRHPWPHGAVVRVRMGLHTGEARFAEGSYVGMDVHRAARICAAGHGGQVLLSDTVAPLVTKDLPDGVTCAISASTGSRTLPTRTACSRPSPLTCRLVSHLSDLWTRIRTISPFS